MQYFVSDRPEPIRFGHPLWDKELPRDYRPTQKVAHTSLTYGAYFSAISDFMGIVGATRLAEIASQIADAPIKPGAISQVDIHLEKHGAFYHPARLNLHVAVKHIACVVNVAMSQMGKDTINAEFESLKRLSRRYADSCLPHVYACHAVRIDDQPDVFMLLGDWFNDFYEFHLSKDKDLHTPAIRIWDPSNPNRFLSPEQSQQIFEQAAMILTSHYCIDTTEQIAWWHHAAGDFVVRINAAHISVKLVTVRKYEPLFNLGQSDVSLESILNTVLIFFLNMCLKLRIDRLDGVGEMAWNHFDVVPSIIRGFFKGLSFQVQNQRIPGELVEAIKLFFLKLPEKDVRDIYLDIADRIDPQSPDFPIVRHNIAVHIAAVVHGFRQLSRSE